ncbi:polysaccharide lyase family 7 protein [Simiduia curdlanivorans]|uniref:Polysaccharide lyase family 7 protein n=1 Tax=Simiduia curdlanivorans TaxID=1492769 RepID=A0ABV8V1N6_9GAMM
MNYKNLFALLAISAFASTANAATFVIEKYGTGFSIDGNGGAIQGQQIYLWGTNTSNVNQKWVQLDRGDGYYAYKKEGTNLCWDGGNGGSKRQAITLQTCDTNNYNQHFSKVKIYAGTEVYRIKKRGVSYSLDGNNGAASRQAIYLWNSSDSNVNQHWEFKSVADSGSSGGGSGSGGGSTGTAEIPSDLMDNCNQWKITYPSGVEDKTLCGEYNNEYFFVNDNRDGIVFKAPIRSNNGSTPNSDYIRSELRERTTTGSSDIYWTTSGTHVVYVKQAITHLPIVKPHLVATQIHGNKSDGIDDAMVLRLENKHLFLSFNGGVLRSDLTIKTNYNLGTKHEVIFEVINGKHYVYYSEDGKLEAAYKAGNASSYLVKDGSNTYVMNRNYDQSYFKIGNYTQSNAEKEGSQTGNANNYGEVVVYDFWVEHK